MSAAVLVTRAELLTQEYKQTIVHVLAYSYADRSQLYLCRVSAGTRCVTQIVDDDYAELLVQNFILEEAKRRTAEAPDDGFERAALAFKVRDEVSAVVSANTHFMPPLVRMIEGYLGRWPWCDEDKDTEIIGLPYNKRERGMIAYEHTISKGRHGGGIEVDVMAHAPCTIVDLRFCLMWSASHELWDTVMDHNWDRDEALKYRVYYETATGRHHELYYLYSRPPYVGRRHVSDKTLEWAVATHDPNNNCLRKLVRLYGVTKDDMEKACARASRIGVIKHIRRVQRVFGLRKLNKA